MLQFKHEGKEIPFSTRIDQFYAGQGKEINNFLNEFRGNVTEIYADGDELQLILSRLNNIPHGHSSTTWRGDWARFIAENFIV
jgi:hypothetical protein